MEGEITCFFTQIAIESNVLNKMVVYKKNFNLNKYHCRAGRLFIFCFTLFYSML